MLSFLYDHNQLFAKYVFRERLSETLLLNKFLSIHNQYNSYCLGAIVIL